MPPLELLCLLSCPLLPTLPWSRWCCCHAGCCGVGAIGGMKARKSLDESAPYCPSAPWVIASTRFAADIELSPRFAVPEPLADPRCAIGACTLAGVGCRGGCMLCAGTGRSSSGIWGSMSPSMSSSCPLKNWSARVSRKLLSPMGSNAMAGLLCLGYPPGAMCPPGVTECPSWQAGKPRRGSGCSSFQYAPRASQGSTPITFAIETAGSRG